LGTISAVPAGSSRTPVWTSARSSARSTSSSVGLDRADLRRRRLGRRRLLGALFRLGRRRGLGRCGLCGGRRLEGFDAPPQLLDLPPQSLGRWGIRGALRLRWLRIGHDETTGEGHRKNPAPPQPVGKSHGWLRLVAA
jgi:hypothetical protein